MSKTDTDITLFRVWLAKQGLDLAEGQALLGQLARFREAERNAVSLEEYSGGKNLKAEDRLRLLTETRESLDADPGRSQTSADIPDTLSDADLFLRWLRA